MRILKKANGKLALRTGKLQSIPTGYTSAYCYCCPPAPCPSTLCGDSVYRIINQVTWNISGIPAFVHHWYRESITAYWVHTIIQGLEILNGSTILTRNGDCSWPEFPNTSGYYERWRRENVAPAYVCPVMADWGIVSYESGNVTIVRQHGIADPIDTNTGFGLSATVSGLSGGLGPIGISFTRNDDGVGFDPCSTVSLRATINSGQPTTASSCRAVEYEYFGTATPSF